MDDIRAIMDAVGSERAAVMGESEGGPLAMLFAAAHPERTVALILQGAEVRERTDDDWPWGEARAEAFEAYDGVASRSAGARDWASTSSLRASRARSGRGRGAAACRCTRRTPAALRRRSCGWRSTSTSVTSCPAINVPTLIVHAVGDQVCHVENARFLARTIPGARYVELPGGDHVPWFDPDETIAEIREFLTGTTRGEHPDRVLATVLFTDLVGSTRARGRARRPALARPHRAASRRGSRELARFDGREVDTAGDGFFATFDGPARAIRCAQAIVEAVRPLGPRGARRPAHGRGRARRRQGRRDRGQHRRARRGAGGRGRGARVRDGQGSRRGLRARVRGPRRRTRSRASRASGGSSPSSTSGRA